MTVNEILDVARDAGISLEPHGDRLRLRAPAKPSEEILVLLHQNKAVIIKHLSSGIGVARPPAPHRRCPSCTGGLQPDDADGSLCSSCRWRSEHLAPVRIQ